MYTGFRPFDVTVLHVLLYIQPEDGVYEPKHVAVNYFLK